MKKKCFIAVVIGAVLAFMTAVYAAEEIPSRVEKASGAIVGITTSGVFGEADANGFVISMDEDGGYIITNSDIFRDDNTEVIIAFDNAEYKGTVVKNFPKKNVAVISTDFIEGIKAVKFNDKIPKKDDSIYINKFIGNKNSTIEGVYAGIGKKKYSEDNKTEVFLYDAARSSEHDGLPLFDKHGYVLGMIDSTGNSREKFGEAVTSEEIMRLLDKEELEYKKATIIMKVLIIAEIAAVVIALFFTAAFILFRKKRSVAYIIGIKGEHEGSFFEIRQNTINIGRDPKSCNIVITNDDYVGRCHCSVTYNCIKKEFSITDFSSQHGTYINGGEIRIAPKQTLIVPSGTEFSIGSGKNHYVLNVGG